MTKEMVLKSIATNGYNIGFGAKKNFASYDIIMKLPSWIGFITLALGIIQLGYPVIGNCKWLSTILILVSVAALYINVQLERKYGGGFTQEKYNVIRVN